MLNSHLFKDWTITITIGLVCGLALILAAGSEPKWFVFILIGLVGAGGLMVLKSREKFLLYFAVFISSSLLDINIGHQLSATAVRPFSGLQITIFDIPFLMMVLSWLLRKIKNPELRIRFYPWFSMPILGIFLIAFVSTINAGDIPFLSSVSMLWHLFENWLVVIYLANNLRDTRTIMIVICLMLASGLVQTVVGAMQYIQGSTLGLGIFGESTKSLFAMKEGSGVVDRAAGLIGHPNQLAMFLGLLLSINTALVFAPTGWRIKKYLLGSLAVLLIGELLTFSRGGWVALGAGSGFVVWWCLARWIRNKVFSAIVLVITAAFMLTCAVILISPVRQRILESDYGTASLRFPLMQVAVNMIAQNPWLGVGPGNYQVVYHQYDDTREAITWGFPAPVHNEILLIASELGVLAALLFLLFIFWRQVLLWRVTKFTTQPIVAYLAIGLFGTWIGWFVHVQVDYAYSLFRIMPFWILTGVSAALSDPSNPIHALPSREDQADGA